VNAVKRKVLRPPGYTANKVARVSASSSTSSSSVGLPLFPANSYWTPMQTPLEVSSAIPVNMTNVARTLFECNHLPMREHESQLHDSITQPTVASFPACENLDNAVMSRPNLQVTVEDYVRRDPGTGSPRTPQCEMSIFVGRDDTDALVDVIDTAIEGFTVEQLSALQDRVSQLFAHHLRDVERRAGVWNPLLAHMSGRSVSCSSSSLGSSSTAYIDPTPLLATPEVPVDPVEVLCGMFRDYEEYFNLHFNPNGSL